MAKLDKTTFVRVELTNPEIEAILKQHLGTMRAGGVVVPEAATFDLSETGATFQWREDRK